jgi:hypothetical protein
MTLGAIEHSYAGSSVSRVLLASKSIFVCFDALHDGPHATIPTKAIAWHGGNAAFAAMLSDTLPY